jgi:putative ABC transport system permease protein
MALQKWELAMDVSLFMAGLTQGLILALIAFGIMITFRLIDLADLTVEGAYPLGGAIYGSLLISGLPDYLAIFIAVLCGGMLSLVTAKLILRFSLNSILAGIIVSTMAYSINLRVMGKPNLSLYATGVSQPGILLLFSIMGFCLILFSLFLRTEIGLRFRVIGLNLAFANHQKIDTKKYVSFGFFLSGALYALSGSLIVSLQGYVDVGMGVGIVIHGLASLMLGERIVGTETITRQLLSPLVGALVYQQIEGIVLLLGLSPSDLKFFTGSIILAVLVVKKGDQYDKA